MTNKERQNSLDKKKWIESERENCDKSGEMNYCDYCLYQDVIYCNATQYEREQNNLCATAYNKMVRKGRKNANNN